MATASLGRAVGLRQVREKQKKAARQDLVETRLEEPGGGVLALSYSYYADVRNSDDAVH